MKIKLRYSTWRRSISVFWVLIVPCIAGAIYFRDGLWGSVFEVLMVIVFAAGSGFHIVVSLLEKAGLLEFTCTEADRFSYLYHAEKLQCQITENRRVRKRE